MMFTTTLMVTIEKKKRKILTLFDDMTADIMTNKRFQAIVKDLFIRCRKLNISHSLILVFQKKLD